VAQPATASHRESPVARGRILIGVSGYDYPSWRGPFYPADLPARRHLEFISRRFPSIELNGTFYSLKSPSSFTRWAEETPDGFIFAIKGSRFITQNLKLTRAEIPLANFYASGVLALGAKTGPFLWQLPPQLRFDPARLDAFIDLLPRTTAAAERLAARYEPRRLKRGALTQAAARARYRHAFEVRHPSWLDPAFFALLRRRRCGFVIADTAATFPYAEEVTADFVYVRLHGSRVLYGSSYTDEELDRWADRIEAWAARGLDVHVYFDNDAHAYAPGDASRLLARCGGVAHDAHALDRDEPAAHHLVQDRHQAVDPLLRIDDLDDDRQVAGEVEDAHRVDDASRPEPLHAAEHRDPGEALLSEPLHERAVEGPVVPLVRLAHEDAGQNLLAIENSHRGERYRPGAPRSRRRATERAGAVMSRSRRP
jgi:uncharacterized protein YecE (DUF72 family)